MEEKRGQTPFPPRRRGGRKKRIRHLFRNEGAVEEKRGQTPFPHRSSNGKATSFAGGKDVSPLFSATSFVRGKGASPLFSAQLVDDAAAHDGHLRVDLFDLIGGDGQVVAVEYHQIGELAGLDRAEIVFLE